MSKQDDLVAATAEEIVAATATDAERLAVFRRRFCRALHYVGWRDVVGDDWVRIGDDGLEFTPLAFKQADAILRDLEDLGRGGVRRGLIRCEGQLAAF
ncbi:MAG: hypothetical protein ABL953_09455 [Ilumatobacteraceae bacterium]